MKLGVVMPLWKRERIAELCLRRVARAAAGCDVELVAVTNEGENGKLAASLGWRVVRAPNHPLGDKFNAGARALRNRVDALVVLGSDNWVCDRFFAQWDALLRDRPVVGIVDSWQICLHRRQALYYPGYTRADRSGESIGAGRALRADVLDRLQWTPWDGRLLKGLDWSMRERLRVAGFDALGRPQEDLGVRLLGIKSEVGMTPFEKFARAQGTRLVSRAAALAPFPLDEQRALEALRAF